jgi:hypothetical protein
MTPPLTRLAPRQEQVYHPLPLDAELKEFRTWFLGLDSKAHHFERRPALEHFLRHCEDRGSARTTTPSAARPIGIYAQLVRIYMDEHQLVEPLSYERQCAKKHLRNFLSCSSWETNIPCGISSWDWENCIKDVDSQSFFSRVYWQEKALNPETQQPDAALVQKLLEWCTKYVSEQGQEGGRSLDDVDIATLCALFTIWQPGRECHLLRHDWRKRFKRQCEQQEHALQSEIRASKRDEGREDDDQDILREAERDMRREAEILRDAERAMNHGILEDLAFDNDHQDSARCCAQDEAQQRAERKMRLLDGEEMRMRWLRIQSDGEEKLKIDHTLTDRREGYLYRNIACFGSRIDSWEPLDEPNPDGISPSFRLDDELSCHQAHQVLRTSESFAIAEDLCRVSAVRERAREVLRDMRQRDEGLLQGFDSCCHTIGDIYTFVHEVPDLQQQQDLAAAIVAFTGEQCRLVTSLLRSGQHDFAFRLLESMCIMRLRYDRRAKIGSYERRMIRNADKEWAYSAMLFDFTREFSQALVKLHSCLEYETQRFKAERVEATSQGENFKVDISRNAQEKGEKEMNQVQELVTVFALAAKHSSTIPAALAHIASEPVGWAGKFNRMSERLGWAGKFNRIRLVPFLLKNGTFEENYSDRRECRFFLGKTYDILGRRAVYFRDEFYDKQTKSWRRATALCGWGIYTFALICNFLLLLTSAFVYWFVRCVLVYELGRAAQLAPSAVARFFTAPLRPKGWYIRSVETGAYVSRFQDLEWTQEFKQDNLYIENKIPRGGALPVFSKLLLDRKFFVLGECLVISGLHYADTVTDVLVIVQWLGKGYTIAAPLLIVCLVLPILVIGFLQLDKSMSRLKERRSLRKTYLRYGIPLPPDLAEPDDERGTFRAIFLDFVASATNLQMLLASIGQLRLEANGESRSAGDGGANDLEKFKLYEAVLEAFPSSTIQLYIMMWELRNGIASEIDFINLFSLGVSMGSIAYAVSDQRRRTVGSGSPMLFPILYCQSFADFAVRTFVIVLFLLE